MYINALSGLNCRKGPGKSYPSIDVYTCGTAVTVEEDSINGWYRDIENNCYVSGDYLSSSKTRRYCTYVIKSYPYMTGSQTENLCSSTEKVCNNSHARYTHCTGKNGRVEYREWYEVCN